MYQLPSRFMSRSLHKNLAKSFLRMAALCLFLAVSSSAFAGKTSAPTRPNILFLFTDDQRFDTVHALGNPDIRTPNIDRLVKDGVAFTNAYIMGGTSPAVCSPSRASLFSGLTLWNLECQGQYGFEISEKFTTLPEAFRNNGYTTFATGKNEPGRAGHFARSFSAAENILFKGMTSNQSRLPLFQFAPDGDYMNKKPVVLEGTHSAEVYAQSCVRFLEKQSAGDEPFFAYVSFQTPHDPRQSPPEFRKEYPDENMKLPKAFLPQHPFDNGMLKIRDEKLAPFPRTEQAVRKHLADYYATITHTDEQIGTILDTLKKTGLRENTIIVFASDNGLAMGSHGLMGKQNIYDHSVHVPMIVSGPGIPKGEKRDQLAYIYDIYPTLCDLAGIETPETVQFKSLTPVLKDAGAKHRDHLYFAFMSWQRAVFDGRHKLIEYCVEGERNTQLFDLHEDPEEITNLANKASSKPKLERLRKLLDEERKSLNDGDCPSPFTNAQGKAFWDTYRTTGSS